MPINVFVVDGTAPMRALPGTIIHGAPEATPDAMIRTFDPDVGVPDAQRPKLDALDCFSSIMRLRSISFTSVSALRIRASDLTLQALESRVFDFVFASHRKGIETYAEQVRDKVRATPAVGGRDRPPEAESPGTGALAPAGSGIAPAILAGSVIAVGASTGGTEAIRDVLSALPAEVPPIVMVQHMPESFTPSFARRLDGLSRLTVIEAHGGERLLPGHAYLAPGHSHMTVKKIAGAYYTELQRTEPVNRHRPAVDVLFHSVAEQVGKHAVGVILTGMGKDGAQGMLAMRRAGAWNIGQDQASCVVYGMPREAVLVGAVDEVATVSRIAERILVRLRQMG
jgi:two-component system chemotaxis response regulator CheB